MFKSVRDLMKEGLTVREAVDEYNKNIDIVKDILEEK